MNKQKVLQIQGQAIQTKIQQKQGEIEKLKRDIKGEEAKLASIVFQLRELKGNSSDDED